MRKKEGDLARAKKNPHLNSEGLERKSFLVFPSYFFLSHGIALIALLLFFPLTICPGATATGQQEYDRILQLISNEDWKTASDAAASYLAKTGTAEDLQARLRYIVIYATAGAVSTGAFDFDVLNKRLKGSIHKSVTLPDRPILNGAQPGSMNAISISDPHATSFMIVAADKTNTTIHAFK